MTKEERIKEIVKASPDFGKRVGYKMCVIDELHDIKELEKEADEFINNNTTIEVYIGADGKERTKTVCDITLKEAYFVGAKPREKRIAELEEKISILLSCKNCPENKGGLLCQKEYEDKCLSQKIQYIKELKEENAELEAKYQQATDEGTSWSHLKSLEKENAELKAQIEKMRNFENCDYQLHITDCPIFKSGGHISCKKCPHWILQEIKEND